MAEQGEDQEHTNHIHLPAQQSCLKCHPGTRPPTSGFLQHKQQSGVDRAGGTVHGEPWLGRRCRQSALHICSPLSSVKVAQALSPAVEQQAPLRWKGNASCVVRSDSHTTEPLDSPEKYPFFSPPQLICPTHTCVHPTLIHRDWGWLLFTDAMRTVGKTEVRGERGEPASPLPGRLAAGFSARQRGRSLQGRPVQEPLGRLEAQLYHMPLCNLWQVP